MFKNIILTGFMGVGKTSVGTRLAQDLGYAFVDTDSLIEADQKIIQQVLDNESQVVSTGGGAVIRDENRAAFKKAGIVICLSARPEVILERIRHEAHRPLLQTPDPLEKIKELLDNRAKFYHQADMIIDTSAKSVDDVISEIKEKVRYARC
jgi:shikimate kinase